MSWEVSQYGLFWRVGFCAISRLLEEGHQHSDFIIHEGPYSQIINYYVKNYLLSKINLIYIFN